MEKDDKGNTIVKLCAIICLTIILIVDFLTMKIDSTLVGTVSAIIGGIAGYEIGKKSMEKWINDN